MKTVTTVVASLLGLMFVVLGLNHWFGFIKIQPNPFPEGSTAPDFWKAMGTSGYISVVKAVEVIGGIALLIPRFRRLGIILVAAIVFNIATYHVVFYQSWASLLDPVVLFAILGTLFLVFTHRLCCCLSGRGCCSKDGSGSCCSGCNCCASGCCGEKAEASSCCSTQSSDKKSGGCGCG